MSDFIIPKGSNTPAVKFMASSCVISIEGNSYPEDARTFYDNLFNKIEPFAAGKDFTFELNFEYLSSSSIACILDRLKHIKADSPTTNFTIRFFYETGDEDMMSIGENYADLSGMKVEFILK